jgi:hypothetical protein
MQNEMTTGFECCKVAELRNEPQVTVHLPLAGDKTVCFLELLPTSVFLNCRAAARYRALASIIPGRERFSWNLSF